MIGDDGRAVRRFRPRRLATSLWLGVALCACANGQDASDVLRQTAETYRALDSYRIEGAVTVDTETASGSQTFDMTVLMAERPANYLRAEIHGPTMQIVVVSNEEGTWMYMPSENRYTRSEVGQNADLGFFSQDLLGEYEQLDEGVVAAAIVGRESVEIGGVARTALVLEVDYASSASTGGADSTQKRIWIDEEHRLVLRDVTRAYVEETPFGEPMWLTETTTFTHITSEAPPVGYFAFVPPDNATFVDPSEIQPAGSVLVAGRPAPPFTLPTLEGPALALSDLRGNVVLINFWATWCGPCRMEMPELERLHQRHADAGLRVIAVNLGEEVEVVRPYVESLNLSFPILLDDSFAIGNLYEAESLPTTVIVDREGRVSSLLLGAHPEEAFLEAVQEAGL